MLAAYPCILSDFGISAIKIVLTQLSVLAPRATAAQWVKRWSADLAVPGSSPTPGEIFSIVNGVALHRAYHYLSPIVLK